MVQVLKWFDTWGSALLCRHLQGLTFGWKLSKKAKNRPLEKCHAPTIYSINFICRAWKIENLRARFFVYIKVSFRAGCVRCYLCMLKLRTCTCVFNSCMLQQCLWEHAIHTLHWSYFFRLYLLILHNAFRQFLNNLYYFFFIHHHNILIYKLH